MFVMFLVAFVLSAGGPMRILTDRRERKEMLAREAAFDAVARATRDEAEASQ